MKPQYAAVTVEGAGELVLADPRAFASLPVSELADRAHVSKPTVVRFCRSLGYDGLADFKLKLAGSVNEGVPFVHRALDEDDKPAELTETEAEVGQSEARHEVAGGARERALGPRGARRAGRGGNQGRRVDEDAVRDEGERAAGEDRAGAALEAAFLAEAADGDVSTLCGLLGKVEGFESDGVRVFATRRDRSLFSLSTPEMAAIASAPLRRLVTLDEVGGCVAFLVGPDATGMTGQTLFVDGGAHAVR